MATPDKSLDLLNKVQQMIIDIANKDGTNLGDHFDSIDAFKEFVIAFTFKALTDNGVEVAKAYDMIFGEGKYEALFESIWSASQPGTQR